MSQLGRLLLVDPDVRGRLRAVSALSDFFEVGTCQDGEDPLRAARRWRPRLVMLGMPRPRSKEVRRACHAIKTDTISPPLVAIVDPFCKEAHPDVLLADTMGDGYLGGKVTPDQLVAFAQAVIAGQRPITLLDRPSGRLGRFLERF